MPSSRQIATLQAAILNVTSSVLAQLLQAYRNPSFPTESTSFNPLGLDFLPILQYLIYCILSTPLNVLWQEYLEKKFPGYPKEEKQKLKVEDEVKGAVKLKLNIRNTGTKFALDQTLGAVVNNILFLLGITLLRGGTWNDALNAVRMDFWPILKAGYKLWPLVSVLNFTVIPVEKRVVVGSMVGLGWGIFMVLRTTT